MIVVLKIVTCLCISILTCTTSTASDDHVNDESFLHYINLTISSAWSHNNIVSNDECPFFYWKYGGAITFDAIFSVINYYYDINSELMKYYNDKIMNPYMNNEWLYKNKTIVGYKIIHNETISFNNEKIEDTIGDYTGIIPIIYIDQIYYNITKVSKNIYNNSDIWYLIFEIVNHYILEWPRKLLFDGTIVRNTTGHWLNQTQSFNGTIVWADDCYMGLTTLNRLIKILSIICFDNNDKYNNDCNTILNNRGVTKYFNNGNNNITIIMEKYISFITKQIFLFNKHLKYNSTNGIFMYAHGYNGFTGHGANTYGMFTVDGTFDVTDTSLCKVRFAYSTEAAVLTSQDIGGRHLHVTFTRLGDT